MESLCKAHSGVEEKLKFIIENQKLQKEQLDRIEGKVEPLSTIGNIASDNRLWLKWLTVFIFVAIGTLIGILSSSGVL